MKQTTSDLDTIISDIAALNGSERVKETLVNICKLEIQLDSLITKKKQKHLVSDSSNKFVQKALRVFIHYEFHTPTQTEPGYFLLIIEGIILDQTYKKAANLCKYFDRIIFVLDGKYNKMNLNFEWNKISYPTGSIAQCVKIKIPFDKACSGKLYFFRNEDFSRRYQVSDSLRQILPFLNPDVTEEEVLLGLWQYCEIKGLFDNRDHRLIHCDENLKTLFGDERMLVSSLKGRLFNAQIILHYGIPVQVDVFLNPAYSVEVMNRQHQLLLSGNPTTLQLGGEVSTEGSSVNTISALYSRIGGRVFELLVEEKVNKYVKFNEKIVSYQTVLESLYEENEQIKSDDFEKMRKELALITKRLYEKNTVLGFWKNLSQNPLVSMGELEPKPLPSTSSFHLDNMIKNRGVTEKQLLEKERLERKRRMRKFHDSSETGTELLTPRPHQQLPQLKKLRTMNSSLHTFSGFLDVGNSSHFKGKSGAFLDPENAENGESWVMNASNMLLLKKQNNGPVS